MTVELPQWDGAMGAVQVWMCPCGSEVSVRVGGVRLVTPEWGDMTCETCGRSFDHAGNRVVTSEDNTDEAPDADLYTPRRKDSA